MLHYNYSDVIWPRCEAVKRFDTKVEFDLAEVLKGTDQEFCEKFGIKESDFTKLRKSRPHKEENDHLWVY